MGKVPVNAVIAEVRTSPNLSDFATNRALVSAPLLKFVLERTYTCNHGASPFDLIQGYRTFLRDT
jgi:hypothetical protein